MTVINTLEDTRRRGSQAPVAVRPSLELCDSFDGRLPAARWLAHLQWEFRRANPNSPSNCNHILQAINILCEDEAAEFLDNSPQLSSAMERAESEVASAADLALVESSLKERFPARTPVELEPLAPSADPKNLRQAQDESLADYFSRTNAILRLAGGRSAARDGGLPTPPLSPLQRFALSLTVEKFVKGLWRNDLRHGAIAKGATNCGSLLQAYEIIETIMEQQEVERNKGWNTLSSSGDAGNTYFPVATAQPGAANSYYDSFGRLVPTPNPQNGSTSYNSFTDYIPLYTSNPSASN